MGFSAIAAGGEGEGKSIKIVGRVTRIEPARIVVRTLAGAEVTLTPLEDFTNRVAVGSQVTAWYYLQGGVSVLERLENSSENASPPPQEVHSHVQEIRPSIKKVILLPSSAVPDGDGIFDAIEKHLQSSFGWYVAPRVLAEEIRNRTGKAVSELEAMDPETGNFDMGRYLGGQQNLITGLASETRVDAVLEVSIEEVMAKVKRMVAAWDGAEEVIGGKGSRTIAKMAIVPPKGAVSATTVVLRLWDAQGQLRWSNRRGLAVLGVHEGMGGKLRYRPLAEYLQDSARVKEWLTTTFGSLPPEVFPDKRVAKKPG